MGLAHEFELDVPMVHNSLYFLNLFMENELEFEKIISSDGTLVDLTPPHPGSYSNLISSDHTTCPHLSSLKCSNLLL